MNIVFYGGHKWSSGPWFRKQQFASRLAERGHNVYYIESGVSMFRKKWNDEYSYFRSKFHKVNSNLTVICPSAMFPFPNNFYLRYLYNLKLFRDIKIYLRDNKIEKYILWFNQVEFSSVINHVNQLKIFDLADDRPFYSVLANDPKGYHTMLRYVIKAFSSSDISITSAIKIKEKYQQYSDREILLVPNGHNLCLDNSDDYKIPADIQGIKKPVIGFVGTLFRFIDDNLIEYIVSNRPNYNFVFVGPVQDNFPVHILKKYNNVFLLGEKLKSEIPSYINAFDICINPFKVHEVNDSVSPVKVFEYLALKKRVVSTQMYSLQKEQISKSIDFVNDDEEFLKRIDDIIINDLLKNNVDDRILEQYSWDNLFLGLISLLNTKYNLSL